MLKKHPTLPAALLAAGVFLSVLALLFSAWLPSIWTVLLAVGATAVAFYAGRFFLCGVLLGIIAVGLNAVTPAKQGFTDCEFNAKLLRPNYSNRYLGQEVRLFADNITCGQAVLPAQTVQYWDNRREFTDLIGLRLSVRANLQPVRSRLNLYQFDYEKYLLSEGVRFRVKKLHISEKQLETDWLLSARHFVAKALTDNLSKPNAAILLALLSGNRTALSPEQKTTMQATGTSHLLAISGLHLALVGGVVWLLFQWLWALSWRLSDVISPRQAGAIAALFAITFYAVFTGFDVPVKRAWVMFSLLILSWLLVRGVSGSSLLLAATAVLFVSPYAAVSVGFYFSFIATFVVLWAARLPYAPLTQVLIMQAVINLTLLPITWATFGIVSLSAFFVNILVIPWLGLWVLPWAIAAVVVQAVSPTLAAPLWSLLEATTGMLWQTIDFAERLNLTFYPAFRPELLAVTIAVCGVIAALISGKKWLFASVFAVFIPLSPVTKPRIVVADSGYTSVLIHNDKQAILINPGRRYRQHNAAKKWRRYLHQHRLELAAVVLESDSLTRISATRWMLDEFPNAKVITATPIHLPFDAQYCRGMAIAHIELHAKRSDSCMLSLTFFGKELSLFNVIEDNAVSKKSELIWQGTKLDAQTHGAVILQHHDGQFSVRHLRNKQRLWRMKIP